MNVTRDAQRDSRRTFGRRSEPIRTYLLSAQDRYVGPAESFEQIEAVVTNLADRMRLRDEVAS